MSSSAPSASAGSAPTAPRPHSATSNDAQRTDGPAPVPAAPADSKDAVEAPQPAPSETSSMSPVVPPRATPEQQDICSLDPSACPRVESVIALQTPIAAAPSISRHHGDIGSKVGDRLVMPSGYSEVRGELAFVTGEAVIAPKRLKMGDLVLFRPSARRAFGEKVELSLGTTLLAKEPSSNRDWIWQGASLGAT